jgi:hypothetical protein
MASMAKEGERHRSPRPCDRGTSPTHTDRGLSGSTTQQEFDKITAWLSRSTLLEQGMEKVQNPRGDMQSTEPKGSKRENIFLQNVKTEFTTEVIMPEIITRMGHDADHSKPQRRISPLQVKVCDEEGKEHMLSCHRDQPDRYCNSSVDDGYSMEGQCNVENQESTLAFSRNPLSRATPQKIHPLSQPPPTDPTIEQELLCISSDEIHNNSIPTSPGPSPPPSPPPSPGVSPLPTISCLLWQLKGVGYHTSSVSEVYYQNRTTPY